eukprot:CAMPEP_0205825008 /NCGR_PEP_ID=MMETSP0206-20130828/23529_1 /ASSEMBLY_ACC=CAM_ASM_000279 /TAXON_ID=36767 /ORGANISM="Euplotes focardii, Strain TN1" /LENGTH=89 /DNA_ID=CAMNT_0053123651 /DNA_START=47 /DNA_END=313 /DNA_ORIENTATION=-
MAATPMKKAKLREQKEEDNSPEKGQEDHSWADLSHAEILSVLTARLPRTDDKQIDFLERQFTTQAFRDVFVKIVKLATAVWKEDPTIFL